MAQRDMLCAALRGHLLRIVKRNLEVPLEAGVAHAVTAFEPWTLV